MTRAFVIKVGYNRRDGAGEVLCTWIQVVEDLGELAPSLRYRTWYHEWVVRKETVKSCIKNHIDFLTSFGIPKESIKIEDLRRSGNAVRGSDAGSDEGSTGSS